MVAAVAVAAAEVARVGLQYARLYTVARYNTLATFRVNDDVQMK